MQGMNLFVNLQEPTEPTGTYNTYRVHYDVSSAK